METKELSIGKEGLTEYLRKVQELQVKVCGVRCISIGTYAIKIDDKVLMSTSVYLSKKNCKGGTLYEFKDRDTKVEADKVFQKLNKAVRRALSKK